MPEDSHAELGYHAERDATPCLGDKNLPSAALGLK